MKLLHEVQIAYVGTAGFVALPCYGEYHDGYEDEREHFVDHDSCYMTMVEPLYNALINDGIRTEIGRCSCGQCNTRETTHYFIRVRVPGPPGQEWNTTIETACPDCMLNNHPQREEGNTMIFPMRPIIGTREDRAMMEDPEDNEGNFDEDGDDQ